MKKRILSALLALAMVSTCLVGCGGNKSSESKSSGKVTKITIAVPDPEASIVIRLRQNLQIVRKNILIIHWSLPFQETDPYMEEIQQLVLNSFRQVLYRC